MSISWCAWERAQYNLVQDFIDLYLPPRYTFSVDKNYPKTASTEALIEGRFNSLELPDTKLLHLQELPEESNWKEFSFGVADWATLFAYNILEGLGTRSASKLGGGAFEELRQLATAWGLRLAHELDRLFHRYEFFTTVGDFIADVFLTICCQIPARELGEAIRESITPAYLRAGETVAYELALFDNNQTRIEKSLAILHASDAELEREIANIFSGYSTKQLGREMQRTMAEAMSELRELFSSKEFKEQFINVWPIVWQRLSWYLGYRLRLNLECDPERTNRLLEAISRHKEIIAVVEQYRYKYGWQGDRNKAINLGWQAVGPKYFHLPRKVEDIKEDDGLEKLIGIAQGLEGYANKNRAIEALTDGFLGKLGAYLARAAKNQETDYFRKQTTDGNIILTKAKHAEDLRHPHREEEEELSDDELLSREKEQHHPSHDSIIEELESKETIEEWYKSLTESEKTATNLKSAEYTEAKIANMMGISQQRVSQLLQQALQKLRKIDR